MQDYFLVIDTETSGLPKKWDAPYQTKNNWPHVLQIAWLIYNSKGELVKKENHYLKPADFKITKASTKIHQITLDFLREKGEDRLKIFKDFSNDISAYQPLIIAHFAELDFCMVGAEYHRLQLPNPMAECDLFCTLKASASYVKNPAFKFLKLNVFYKTLFKKRPKNLHNALADAELTAEIFFHLLQKGEVTPSIIENQSKAIKKDKFATTETPKLYFIALIIVLLISIAIYYYGK
ncbi:MAG TPA: 3'-5' exonuclease [Pelobium sp.]|nr:3'-5' exonuclease [Pelobium sp.]